MKALYKKAVLKKFRNIHGKTPVLESLFNSEYWEIFKRTYFEEHLQTATSENAYEIVKN